MHFTSILLDGIGGAFLLIVPGMVFLHLIITVFIEAGILYLFDFDAFKKCVLRSVVVNLVSLIAGLILFSFGLYRHGLLVNAILLLALTIIVEFIILFQMRGSFPIRKLFIASIIMNLITNVIFLLLWGLVSYL